jgi:hypothetical protein
MNANFSLLCSSPVPRPSRPIPTQYHWFYYSPVQFISNTTWLNPILHNINITRRHTINEETRIFRLHLTKFFAQTQPDTFQNLLSIHPQASSLAFPYLLSTEFSDSRISTEIFKFLHLYALWQCFPLRIHLGNDDDDESITEYCCAPKREQVYKHTESPVKTSYTLLVIRIDLSTILLKSWGPAYLVCGHEATSRFCGA